MADIFISHVEEDFPIVEELGAGLEAAGYSTWYYERDNVPGLSYLDQISDALTASQAILLVISPKTLTSDQVDHEIQWAYEDGKYFLPVLLGLTVEDFKRRKPRWRMILGTASVVTMAPQRSGSVITAVVKGIQRYGVVPEAFPAVASAPDEAEAAKAHPLSRNTDDATETPEPQRTASDEPSPGNRQSDRETTPQTLVLNRYRIEQTIGEGGFGRVYRAFDTLLDTRVVLKVIRHELASTSGEVYGEITQRFQSEAMAGARVRDCPQILTIFDLTRDAEQNLYLVMEYMSGGTLRDRIAHGPLRAHDALQIAGDIAKGLIALHEKDIVHRDIKPTNIFFTANGQVKIGDLGIAQMGELSMRAQVTIGHPGTPLYMSPEQNRSTGYLPPSTDQYSLGLVIFEMLAGEAYRKSFGEQRDRVLSLLPSEIMTLINRMTADEIENRYPTMQAAHDAIIAALDAVPDALPLIPFTPQLPPRPDALSEQTRPARPFASSPPGTASRPNPPPDIPASAPDRDSAKNTPQGDVDSSLIFGRYRFLQTLQDNYMTQVYRARDTRLQHDVVIKVIKQSLAIIDPHLHTALVQQLRTEAMAGARLGNNPFITNVFALEADAQGALYLIRDYIPGGTLHQHLRTHGPCAVRHALGITKDVASGLAVMHENGLVHRNVTPSNIFLTDEAHAQIGDFGIVQLDAATILSSMFEQSDRQPGALWYRSPEQQQNVAYLRGESDQYSLGLVLFEILTGKVYRHLFTEERNQCVISLPRTVAQIIQRMTMEDPEQRYHGMEAVRQALLAAM